MADNQLCGIDKYSDGTFTTEGIAMLGEAFAKMPQLSALKCARPYS